MRSIGVLAAAAVFVPACTKPNPTYCELPSDCESGVCEMHTCVPAADADPDAPDADTVPVCEPKIAWLKQDGSYYDVYVANSDGSGAQNVTESTGLPFFYSYAWSSDGARLAYLGLDGLHVVDADGSNDMGLTTEADLSIEWSPESDRVVFVRGVDGRSELWRRDTNGGTGELRLSQAGTYDDTAPSWSPDGDKIAFVSDRSGNSDIYVIDANGQSPDNLTNHPLNDGDSGAEAPQWSPDGSRILFISARSGNRDVWAMNADGSEPRNLTQSTIAELHPRWSPDGSQIMYTVTAGLDQSVVYLMNSDGSNQHAIAAHNTIDEQGEFSPDGTRFVWQTNRITSNGDLEIYVAGIDGASPIRITTDEDNDDRMPSWQPCP